MKWVNISTYLERGKEELRGRANEVAGRAYVFSSFEGG